MPDHERHAETFEPDDEMRQLAQAIHDVDLCVFYQPEVDLTTGRLLAFEALVRWNHPMRGQLEAREFIDLAEKTSLVVGMDRWVIREACRQLSQWTADLPDTDIAVRVNVSPPTLESKGLTEFVSGALEEHGIAPRRLSIEITERMPLLGADDKGSAPHRLRALGVQLGLDSWGNGYHSISVLSNLPLSFVTLDTSQFRVADRVRGVLLEVNLRLTSEMGLDVIATHVANEADAESLRQLGFVHGQGYHFAHPMSVQTATEFLVVHNEQPISARRSWRGRLKGR